MFNNAYSDSLGLGAKNLYTVSRTNFLAARPIAGRWEVLAGKKGDAEKGIQPEPNADLFKDVTKDTSEKELKALLEKNISAAKWYTDGCEEIEKTAKKAKEAAKKSLAEVEKLLEANPGMKMVLEAQKKSHEKALKKGFSWSNLDETDPMKKCGAAQSAKGMIIAGGVLMGVFGAAMIACFVLACVVFKENAEDVENGMKIQILFFRFFVFLHFFSLFSNRVRLRVLTKSWW